MYFLRQPPTNTWGELARLSLDTIHSVVGLAMTPEDFLTPDGAEKALNYPSTFKQIVTGIKDSKNILGAISAVDALRGIFRDAESSKLSFQLYPGQKMRLDRNTK